MGHPCAKWVHVHLWAKCCGLVGRQVAVHERWSDDSGQMTSAWPCNLCRNRDRNLNVAKYFELVLSEARIGKKSSYCHKLRIVENHLLLLSLSITCCGK